VHEAERHRNEKSLIKRSKPVVTTVVLAAAAALGVFAFGFGAAFFVIMMAGVSRPSCRILLVLRNVPLRLPLVL
jgi:hypothetical protein